MGIFGKVILGGLAFLAGAAFMADENEKQRKHGISQHPWPRIPGNPLLNADKAPITSTPNVKEWLDKNADVDDETKKALRTDFEKLLKDWNRQKEEVGKATAPLFGDPPATQQPTFMDPPVLQQATQPPIVQQQPIFKFPIYSGSQTQNGPWSCKAPDFEKARQIGVLEVYRDSLSELIDMPEFKDLKLDKEGIKKFFDNPFVQSFIKARLAGIGVNTDWFRTPNPAPAASQPTATPNPAPATEPAGSTIPASINVDKESASSADTVEHRDSSVISISGGPIGINDLIDPVDRNPKNG